MEDKWGWLNVSGAVQPILSYGSTGSPPVGIWTAQASGFGADLVLAAAYNGSNLYVIVGTSGKISTSPDGATWTLRANPFNGFNSFISGVIWDGTQFIAAANDTVGRVGKSADGITWVVSILPNNGANAAQGISFGNGVYVITQNSTGAITVGNGNYWTSVDAVTWTPQNTYASGGFSSILFDGVDFVASTLDSITGSAQVAYSSDGINWTQNPVSSFPNNASNVITSNGTTLYIIISGSSDQIEKSSSRIWVGTAEDPGLDAGGLGGIAYGGSVFVIVDDVGQAASSPNGVTWTPENPLLGGNFGAFVYFGGGLFIAGGGAGSLSTRV